MCAPRLENYTISNTIEFSNLSDHPRCLRRLLLGHRVGTHIHAQISYYFAFIDKLGFSPRN